MMQQQQQQQQHGDQWLAGFAADNSLPEAVVAKLRDEELTSALALQELTDGDLEKLFPKVGHCKLVQAALRKLRSAAHGGGTPTPSVSTGGAPPAPAAAAAVPAAAAPGGSAPAAHATTSTSERSRTQDYEPPVMAPMPLVGLFGPSAVPAHPAERTLEAILAKCWPECPPAVMRAVAAAADDAVVGLLHKHGSAALGRVPRDALRAVYVYTAETAGDVARPLYATLNGYLRARDRDALKAYRPYVRLLLQGIRALEEAGLRYEGTVYRGIRMSSAAEQDELVEYYKQRVGRQVAWCGFSSCTRRVDALQSAQFLGPAGLRVQFVVERAKGLDVMKAGLSAYGPAEAEVLLACGTQVEVVGVLNMGHGLWTVQLRYAEKQWDLLGDQQAGGASPQQGGGGGERKDEVYDTTRRVWRKRISVEEEEGGGTRYAMQHEWQGVRMTLQIRAPVQDVQRWRVGHSGQEVELGAVGLRAEGLGASGLPVVVVVEGKEQGHATAGPGAVVVPGGGGGAKMAQVSRACGRMWMHEFIICFFFCFCVCVCVCRAQTRKASRGGQQGECAW